MWNTDVDLRIDGCFDQNVGSDRTGEGRIERKHFSKDAVMTALKKWVTSAGEDFIGVSSCLWFILGKKPWTFSRVD